MPDGLGWAEWEQSTFGLRLPRLVATFADVSCPPKGFDPYEQEVGREPTRDALSRVGAIAPLR
jgi:hypothetical protein